MTLRYLTNLGRSSAILLAVLLAIQIAAALPPAFDSINSQNGAENSLLSFTVHAADPENSAIIYSSTNLPSGSALNPTTGQFTWTPGYTQSGNYVVEFSASDGTESSNVFVTVIIVNTNRPPVLVEINPLSINENSPVSFSAFATDPDSDAVVYSGSPLPSGSVFISGTGLFTWTPTYSQAGSYTINFVASDGTLSDQMSVVIVVNNVNTAPAINLLYPISSISNSFTSLNVTTDKESICKYASSNTEYDQMATFEKTGLMAHGTLLTGISGTTTYYVKCKSLQGDIGSASFGITVSSAPKAEILLSPPSPAKPGLMKITLVTTTSMQFAPSLYYFFDETPSDKKLISLESVDGSSTLWSGHMVIPPVKGIKTGTFEFRGTDLSGAVGSEIKSGKTFIADDEAPEPPKTFKIQPVQTGIALSWTLEGEAAKEFRVYKKAASPVTFADLYLAVNGTKYIDTEVSAGTIYYYKITAVDLAGNEGDLSLEYSAMAPDTSKPTPTSTAVITPKLSSEGQKKINATVKEIDRAILDLNLVDTTLESMTGEPEKKVSEKLKLKDRSTQLKSELEGMKNELKNMDVFSSTEEDVEKMRERALLKLKKANLSAVKSVSIIEDSRSLQLLSPERIESLGEASVLKINMSSGQKSSYVKQFKEWNLKLKVNVRIISANLKFLDDHEEQATIVSKDTTYESPILASNAWVMERIPKEVAQRASELQFDPAPTIVEDDPLLRWSMPEGDFQHITIEYVLSKRVSTDTLKATSTYMMQDPAFFLSQKTNQISSFSIFPPSGKVEGPGLLGWSLIIGILTVGSLGGVYVYLVSSNKSKSKKKTAETTPFIFDDGSSVKDIPELLEKLQKVDDETFKRHAIPEHNDFCIWMHEALDEKDIALDLYEITDKKEFMDKLFQLYTDKTLKNSK